MAKIRVYELAKKLNLTNKALLSKLKTMSIEVKSHMSTLEDEDVAKVKTNLFGKKGSQTETRVKPSVIRRRKRVKKGTSEETSPTDAVAEATAVEDAAEHSETDAVAADSQTAPEAPEDDTRQKIEAPPADVSAAAAAADDDDPSDSPRAADGGDVIQDPVTDAPSDGKPPATGDDPAPPAGKSRTRKKRPAARIISRPDAGEDETESVSRPDAPADTSATAETGDKGPEPTREEPAAEALEKTGATAKADTVESSQSPVVTAGKGKEEPSDPKSPSPSTASGTTEDAASAETDSEKDSAAEKAESGQGEAEASAPDTAPAQDTEDQTSPDARESAEKTTPPPKKKSKKQSKSEPAKIIKLAVPPVIPSRKRNSAAGDVGGGAGASRRRMAKSPFPKGTIPGTGPSGGGQPETPPLSPEELASKDRKQRSRKKKKETQGFDPARGGGRKRRSVEGRDLYDSSRGGKKGRRRDNRSRQRAKAQKTQITTPKAIKRRIKIDETIELSDLAKRMGIKANEMIVKLMGMGVMATVNQTIDFDTASLVAAEFNYEVERASFEEELILDVKVDEDPGTLMVRPPVVTIMGHVDHGKTSLLDVIRKSRITTGEAGGITQHIGAYSVETPNGVITFLDTPGHAAFTAMRSRGAQVTDLVVLVVAADDGVMPQTIEAINHSKAADVPVIVAVNKMDKPDADPDRVMRELSEHGMVSEEWGGDVIFARVSAKAETGIDDLLEMILLQAEVLELKANPDRAATGHVVEARLDAGRGPVATVLVEQGTLRAGDPLVCGLHSGKIRVMVGDTGDNVTEAGPSMPVEIVGLSGVPEAGDELVALASEKDAKQISEHRMQKERAKELAKKSRANLEKLFANMGADQARELKLIIKADVQGSLEALNDSLLKLAQEEVDIKIVHSATGAINESDISLAAVSDAIIIGFNVRPTPKVREMAKEENIDMRFYDIIYNVINDIKAALTGLMPSTFHENVLGRAEVRDTFVIPNRGTIAGCFVTDGRISRNDKIRLLRDGVVKCDTAVGSLRRFKDDVKEVAQGYECGIGLEKFNDIKTGDVLECYEIEERKASLEQIKE